MTAHSEDVVRARLMLATLSLIWGITWPAMRIALDEVPPFSMRVATTFLGALTLCAIVRLQQRSFRIGGAGAWLHVTIAAMLNIVGFTLLTAFAQIQAATSRVAILTYTMPIWATLLARAIVGERINALRATGLALCAVGVAILIHPLVSAGIPVGLLLALAAGASWGAGTVYLKWARIEGHPLAIVAWQGVVAFLAVALCQPIVEGSPPALPESGTALLAVAFTGAVGSGLAYIIWFDSVRRLPAATASLGILAAPVIGVISSTIILGERPTGADLIGFAFILAAAACVLMFPQPVRVRAQR
jgi:drug/metabolite transporter (DMT)-like permease